MTRLPTPTEHQSRDAMNVTLPWPDRLLSPNSRVHWAAHSKAKARARRDAFLLARAAGLREVPAASIRFTFRPPDKRRRDLDNCIASMKAASDGIADALGLDDAKWAVLYAFGDVTPGGAVIVQVTA